MSSHVRGTIAIDVAFTDSTTVDGAQSLKTITLRDATEYASGTVAVVTGTVGTTKVTIDPYALSYRDSSGSTVSLDVERVAIENRGPGWLEVSLADPNNTATDQCIVWTNPGNASVGTFPGVDSFFRVRAVNGTATASYTLVLYGA
jgi:hypothetical protein